MESGRGGVKVLLGRTAREPQADVRRLEKPCFLKGVIFLKKNRKFLFKNLDNSKLFRTFASKMQNRQESREFLIGGAFHERLKAASKRAQSQTGLNSAERKQARSKNKEKAKRKRIDCLNFLKSNSKLWQKKTLHFW